jgi:hypothetical protein
LVHVCSKAIVILTVTYVKLTRGKILGPSWTLRGMSKNNSTLLTVLGPSKVIYQILDGSKELSKASIIYHILLLELLVPNYIA